jgi:hypothetical protein
MSSQAQATPYDQAATATSATREGILAYLNATEDLTPLNQELKQFLESLSAVPTAEEHHGLRTMAVRYYEEAARLREEC